MLIMIQDVRGLEMIFEFESGNGKSIIHAIFEESDSHTGKRQEGPGTLITFSGDPITFDYEVQTIHPDILGLICLCIFHPFIGERVIFPKPVSPRLKEAFDNKCFGKYFRFDNIDESIEIYSGEKLAISFGGGIDSSAVRVVFPEAHIVHEAHIRNGDLVPSHSHSIVSELGSENATLVTTNQRYVSRPGGWHGWTCSTITSLLLATDHQFGVILTGSILGSTMLNNGRSYWDRYRARGWHGPTGNFWQSAFQQIGIPMFSPMTGASEFITMQASIPLLEKNEVVYCMEENGAACNKCSKCFRRAVIRNVVDDSYFSDLEEYNTSEIHKFLEKRPLYFGHIFSFARRKNSLPEWVLSRLENVPAINSDWLLKVHPYSFDFIEQPWNKILSERMKEHFPFMDDEEIKLMEGWTQE